MSQHNEPRSMRMMMMSSSAVVVMVIVPLIPPPSSIYLPSLSPSILRSCIPISSLPLPLSRRSLSGW